MSYLVVGAGGALGRDIVAALAGRDVTALSRAQLDVTDADAVTSAVDAGYDVIVNASAYTRVDDAESNEDEARAANATAVANLARAAASTSATLVQISTDYVFDGSATTPYAEDSELGPVSVYGRTKAEGEQLALALNPGRTFVVRTAWLYGANGANFVKTVLQLAETRDQLSVVTDQIGQPTWTRDLAAQIVLLLDSGAPAGIYHGTSSGQCSWYEFARAVFSEAGFDANRVRPTDSSQFVRPAARPAYSVLGHASWAAAGMAPMRDWRTALTDAFSAGGLARGAQTTP